MVTIQHHSSEYITLEFALPLKRLALYLGFIIVKTHSFANITFISLFYLNKLQSVLLAKAEWKALTCISAAESQNIPCLGY